MNTVISNQEKNKKNWDILSLINWSTEYLNNKNFSSSRLITELLLSHVLKKERIYLYTHFDEPLNKIELSEFKKIFERVLKQEPIQYILGETSFYGFKIKCNSKVLIPRPESEVIVDKVLEYSKNIFQNKIKILDIGTGSGCISIALKKLIPNSILFAIDSSIEALELAEENAKLNNVKIDFKHVDIMNEAINEEYDIIVSNPPYISEFEFNELPESIKLFEPKNSLTDYSDGLKFYKNFAIKLKNNISNNGFCIFEHGYNQKDEIAKIFSDWKIIETFSDYSKIPRGIILKKWKQ